MSVSSSSLKSQDLPLPRHSQNYYELVIKHPDLSKSVNALSKAEVVDGLKNMNFPTPYIKTVDEAKYQIALIHWLNPICNVCSAKGPKMKMYRCNKCNLIWYCSKSCHEKEKEQHAKVCCDPDADFDKNSPYKVVVLAME